MMEDVEAIVAKLTKAQKEAMVSAPSTPLGNTWLTCNGMTKLALVARRLASGHGDWCTLTDLGTRVRTYLLSQTKE